MARRAGAAVLALVVLVSGTVSASLVYRCPMDDEVAQRRRCCPPAETDSETPTMSRGCCQAEELAAAAPAPSETARPALDRAPPPVVAVVHVSPAPAEVVDAVVVPHAQGPPIVLCKQAFLR